MRARSGANSPRSARRRTRPRLPRPPSSTCALSTCPGHFLASAGTSSPARMRTPRGTARPWRRNKAFPSNSAKRIMLFPSPRAAGAFRPDPSMPEPAFERLPFLDAQPWRGVGGKSPGRYARNQVAGLIAAGTPLVGGIALGRGGETMDGLPLYDRGADPPERPNVAVLYTPAEGGREAMPKG